MACDERGFNIGVKARDKKLYVVRDMMIRQYSGYQIMMYFAKGIILFSIQLKLQFQILLLQGNLQLASLVLQETTLRIVR